VGIVASSLGATHVALTDLVDAIPGLEEHRSMNDLENVICEPLDWLNDDDHAKLTNPKVDMILAADVIYFPGEELASALINTFRRLCKPDTVILLAYEFRGD
jgi:predicted nicotinamide N-methyase